MYCVCGFTAQGGLKPNIMKPNVKNQRKVTETEICRRVLRGLRLAAKDARKIATKTFLQAVGRTTSNFLPNQWLED